MPDTSTINDPPGEGKWVLFDGDCPLCAAWALRVAPMLRRRGFRIAPLQTPWVCERLGIAGDDPPSEMRVIAHDGCVLDGADAVVYLAGRLWWGWPLYVFARIPGAMPPLRAFYRFIARHRHRIAGRAHGTKGMKRSR
jgi:predicted DCC family thiol-disulfide oxidoreductase YuxK